ncbi:MAG: BatA domain-containing protein [Chloroflexi bacterium]|nr:BatA domain-containing protein [Chloroflexota bacterium]
MNFLTPLAFALAVLLPIIVALYFLKLRREEQHVSSTYLWRTLVRDMAANAPWQKLKPNLLLLLQLLFLIILILTLARPFVWGETVAGSHLILVVDTSASMGATDVTPNRLVAAIASARQLVDGLPSSARVTVIDAGAQVRVPVSSASDRGAALAALDALHPGTTGADFASALTLAAAIAAREPDSEIVILSDGHIALPENFTLPSRVQYISIGKENNNQAIGAFSLQTESGGRTLTAFVQAINFGSQEARRRLVLRADGQLLSARDLTLTPSKSQAITIPDLPANMRSFEATLEGQDALATDDNSWAVSPSSEKISVRIVSTGNRFLETALRLMPNVETTVYTPTSNLQSFDSAQDKLPTSNFQLTIFDSVISTGTLPTGDLFFIAPLRSTEFFSVTGRVDAPIATPVVADDPLLRYVDLRDVVIQDATRIALPIWGRAVMIDSKTNAPLLVIGEQDGRRIAILAFDLRRSDLPLRVAFPLLMANLLDALVPGGASGIPANVEPGKPLAITAPPQTTLITVRTPDGQSQTMTPTNGRVVFMQTNRLGVYEIASQDKLLGRFAVNLFNANESDIAPRGSLPIAASAPQSKIENQKSKTEWWQPLAWLALALLVIEWLYAYRGQVARVWNLGVGRLVKRNL